MSDIKLKVNEVAKEIGESVHVVRNWMRDFREHIPSEKSDAGYNLFGEDAVSVLRQIQKLVRDQKFSTKQIEHFFFSGGDPFGSTPEEIERNDKLDDIIGRLDRQDEFNQVLITRLDEQSKRMENFVRDRDAKLMLTLREIQETKRLQVQKKWFEIWK